MYDYSVLGLHRSRSVEDMIIPFSSLAGNRDSKTLLGAFKPALW